MLLKAIVLLSATILPMPLKAPSRGRRGRGDLSPSFMPAPDTAASFRPTMTDPRGGPVAPADLSKTRHDASHFASDASPDDVISLATFKKSALRNVADLDTYWERVNGLKVASTRAFARWMRTHDLSGDLSLRELMSAYTEFCWTHDLKPLSERSLLNRLKKAGFETCRPPGRIVNGKLHRPTIYRLKQQKAKAA